MDSVHKAEKTSEIARYLLGNVVELVIPQVEEARKMGEDFHLLRLIQMDRKEVKTHTPILSDLLDPGGTHGQNDLFLRTFIEILKRAIDSNRREAKSASEVLSGFQFSEARVLREKRVSNSKGELLGQIDILISEPDSASSSQRANTRYIIIENKLDAVDQDKQLERYSKFSEHSTLVYLTLDGREPPNQDFPEDRIVRISYKDSIVAWLEECIKSIPHAPHLREGLNQYLDLVRFVTNQTHSFEMKNKIANLVLDGTNDRKNLEAYLALIDSHEEVQRRAFRLLREDVINRLRDSEAAHEPSDWKDGIFFRVPGSYHSELLYGIGNEFKDPYFGFFNSEKITLDEATVQCLQSHFITEFDLSAEEYQKVWQYNSAIFPAWKPWESLEVWDGRSLDQLYKTREQLIDLIITLVNRLKSVAEASDLTK